MNNTHTQQKDGNANQSEADNAKHFKKLLKTAEELNEPLKEYKDYFVVPKNESINLVLAELFKKQSDNPESFKKAASDVTNKLLNIIDNRWEQVRQNAIKLHKLSGEALTNPDNRPLRKHFLDEMQKSSSMYAHAGVEQNIIRNVLRLDDSKKALDKKELVEIFTTAIPSRLNSNAKPELQRSNSNISISSAKTASSELQRNNSNTSFSSVKTASSYAKIAPPKLQSTTKKSQVGI